MEFVWEVDLADWEEIEQLFQAKLNYEMDEYEFVERLREKGWPREAVWGDEVKIVHRPRKVVDMGVRVDE